MQLEKRKFSESSTALEVIEGHRLDGKTAIVTGAYAGIGFETARALASAGATVILAGRDGEKGKEAVLKIQEISANEKIHFAAIDLFDLASVQKFSKEIIEEFHAVSILINNAGIMAGPLSYSADGYESQFATNHLGHFLLAYLLKDALAKAAPSRVVSLSSIAHRRSDIIFDDIHYRNRHYDKWQAYGQSKTANVLFALGLTEQWQRLGICSNAVMPGGIVTGLQKYIPVEEQVELGWIDENGNVNGKFKTPEQGAATSIWAAVSEEMENRGGYYLEDCAIASAWHADTPLKGCMPHALNRESAQRLWEMSLSMTQAYHSG